MLSTFKTLTLASGALALALTAAGCGSDCEGDSCSVEGSVAALSGAEVPTTAQTIVVWSVAAETPDAGYKFGAGTSEAATFVVSLDGTPPAEAIGADGVGVGFIGLVAADADVPDGTFDASEAALLGISREHAIIYKSADATGLAWSADFDDGYSCGLCVKGTGEEFDTFTQAECEETTIEVSDPAPALDVCAWM